MHSITGIGFVTFCKETCVWMCDQIKSKATNLNEFPIREQNQSVINPNNSPGLFRTKLIYNYKYNY